MKAAMDAPGEVGSSRTPLKISNGSYLKEESKDGTINYTRVDEKSGKILMVGKSEACSIVDRVLSEEEFVWDNRITNRSMTGYVTIAAEATTRANRASAQEFADRARNYDLTKPIGPRYPSLAVFDNGNGTVLATLEIWNMRVEEMVPLLEGIEAILSKPADIVPRAEASGNPSGHSKD